MRPSSVLNAGGMRPGPAIESTDQAAGNVLRKRDARATHHQENDEDETQGHAERSLPPRRLPLAARALPGLRVRMTRERSWTTCSSRTRMKRLWRTVC